MTKNNPAISEIKLTYTRKVKANERPIIVCPEDAYKLFRDNWDDMTINLQEEFKILLLDRNNAVMGIVPISKGGVSATIVDAKLIFGAALKARSCSIILGHNHPSGNIKPSLADRELTERLSKAGNYLHIPIVDHIIVADKGFSSFVSMNYIKELKP